MLGADVVVAEPLCLGPANAVKRLRVVARGRIAIDVFAQAALDKLHINIEIGKHFAGDSLRLAQQGEQYVDTVDERSPRAGGFSLGQFNDLRGPLGQWGKRVLTPCLFVLVLSRWRRWRFTIVLKLNFGVCVLAAQEVVHGLNGDKPFDHHTFDRRLELLDPLRRIDEFDDDWQPLGQVQHLDRVNSMLCAKPLDATINCRSGKALLVSRADNCVEQGLSLPAVALADVDPHAQSGALNLHSVDLVETPGFRTASLMGHCHRQTPAKRDGRDAKHDV